MSVMFIRQIVVSGMLLTISTSQQLYPFQNQFASQGCNRLQGILPLPTGPSVTPPDIFSLQTGSTAYMNPPQAIAPISTRSTAYFNSPQAIAPTFAGSTAYASSAASIGTQSAGFPPVSSPYRYPVGSAIRPITPNVYGQQSSPLIFDISSCAYSSPIPWNTAPAPIIVRQNEPDLFYQSMINVIPNVFADSGGSALIIPISSSFPILSSGSPKPPSKPSPQDDEDSPQLSSGSPSKPRCKKNDSPPCKCPQSSDSPPPCKPPKPTCPSCMPCCDCPSPPKNDSEQCDES